MGNETFYWDGLIKNSRFNYIFFFLKSSFAAKIDHFTVVFLVTWPLNGNEAEGDLVLIQTSLLLLCKSSCSYANYLAFT